MFSEMRYNVVWYKITDVLEEQVSPKCPLTPPTLHDLHNLQHINPHARRCDNLKPNRLVINCKQH
jgi:hypothetical protein